MTIRSVEDLDVYRRAYQAAMEVFRLSRPFPKEERHSLTDQIVRSSRSVAANIREGFAKREYENVFLLQPTNPLRPKKLLHEAYPEFKKGYDSLFTVTRSHQKLGKIVNGVFEPFNYTPGQRSQDMEPLFFENGLLYIAKGDLILNNKLMGEKCLPFEVDHFFAHIDIDTEQDFNLANIAYNHSF